MHVLWVYSVYAVLSVTGWSPVQEGLQTVYRIRPRERAVEIMTTTTTMMIIIIITINSVAFSPQENYTD
jgi:hypothetical protein